MLAMEIRFFPGVFVGKSWVIKVFTEYHSPMFHILLAKDNHDSPVLLFCKMSGTNTSSNNASYLIFLPNRFYSAYRKCKDENIAAMLVHILETMNRSIHYQFDLR